MRASKLARKVLSVVCAFALILTAVPLSGVLSGLSPAAAADDEGSAALSDVRKIGATYDFTRAEDYPQNMPEKDAVMVDYGRITVRGSSVTMNQGGHGISLYSGISVDIRVAGPTRIAVYACNNYGKPGVNLTLKEGDLLHKEWKVESQSDKAERRDVGMVYEYTDNLSTTLTLTADQQTYIHRIVLDPLNYDINDWEKTYTFNVSEYDLEPQPRHWVVDKRLTVAGRGFEKNHNGHGVLLKGGSSINVKVISETTVTFLICAISDNATVEITDGSQSETMDIKKAGADDVVKFPYKHEGGNATLCLTNISSSGQVYVHGVEVDPRYPDLNENIDLKGSAKKDTVGYYSFATGTMEPEEEVDGVKTAISKDHLLAVKGNFNYGTQGIIVFNDDAFYVKVAGDSIIEFYGPKISSAVLQASVYNKMEADGAIPIPKNNSSSSVSFEYTGGEAVLKFTVSGASGEVSVYGISVTNKIVIDSSKPAGDKIDVWDFAAEKLLPESRYNNKLTAEIINGLYGESVKAGSSGVSIGSFHAEDIIFYDNGKNNNRIRTTNETVTRYDNGPEDEPEKVIDDITFRGQLYSNTSSTKDVYLGIKLYENDILTVYAGSNGGKSTIYCESPSGKIQVGHTNAEGAALTFYADEYGIYKLYSIDEKLVVYRALREHTTPVRVSGSVTAASGIPTNYMLRFTSVESGAYKDVSVRNGAYSVYLNKPYTYKVSLVNATAFIIRDNVLNLENASSEEEKNITIEAVATAKVTGTISGIDKLPDNFNLSFDNKSAVYDPNVTLEINGNTYSIELEKGVEYSITAYGVNDYQLAEPKITVNGDITRNLVFSLKDTYPITVKYDGDIPESATKTAILTFTNIEDGYVYKFDTGNGENPMLRDGDYDVKVTGTGSADYVQKLTSNVKVKGGAVEKHIEFEKITAWDFSVYNTENGGTPGLETIGGKDYYLGLVLSGSVQENKSYLLVGSQGAGEVKIPVDAGKTVTIEFCYQADFKIGNVTGSTNSKSTSTIERVQVENAQPVDGYLTLNASSNTYLTKITVSDPPTEYKAEITVGSGKNYPTINKALEAVANMKRTESQRVTIVIDPGNYEEMLVIDLPNITLKNAAASPSLEIKNKGVDIGENAVRITSYYGHGYDYYSMGSDGKRNEEILKVNKENGYISAKNPGAGTTNGSYWNATVVVNASGFEADGIIFENSFNQYISRKESEDKLVMWESESKGERPTAYRDTSVQQKKYVERAAALAIANNSEKIVFNNCKFIGRQDTLYGGTGVTAVFQKCDVLGSVDFIFGAMTAVFYRCNLVMDTDSSDDSADAAYIAAAQQSSGRGYLMYECNITSTTPDVDTASAARSKPGYFGRPWQAKTSEAVFYKTTIETTNTDNTGDSLILPEGWSKTLGGESPGMYEYGTVERNTNVDNSKNRVDWATVLTGSNPVLNDGKPITMETFLGDWAKELKNRKLVLEPNDSGYTKPV